MSRRALLLALLAIPIFFVAAIPAVAKKAKASSAPVVTSVKPLKLKIGERLTIHGKNFIKGRHKDTIVFMGAGKRVVWVKADTASKNTLTVKLPTKLAVLLADKTGKQQPTRLLIRVIARKSGRSFTKRAKSPVVSPNASIQTGTPAAEPCPGYSNSNADSDGDFLSNGLELALGTNPCKADTDGDGVSDGYEYQAALDLNRNANSSSIPWPAAAKRPYPNPLDPNDGNTDYDGDSLTLKEEYTASFAWLLGLDPTHTQLDTFVPYVPNPNPYNDVMVVSYSDGDQTTNPTAQGNPPNSQTGPAAPTDPNAQSIFDVNGDGTVNATDGIGFEDLGGTTGLYDSGTDVPGNANYWNNEGLFDTYLSDDEKDIDRDGLSNFDETHGPLSGQGWWASNTSTAGEGTYPIAYDGTNWLDPDTDGDGILDGADDQDHDGYTNIEEDMPDFVAGPFMAWAAANGADPAVNPFNPCLPNDASPACIKHPTAGASYAPFNHAPDATWHTWPAP
jgi:IPT/TIG domain-containing protein/thrombospondin type 3 repeat protein